MKYTITESGDERHPYALLDETDTVVRVDTEPAKLSRWAFDNGADEVRHEYDGSRIVHAVFK